MRGGGTKTGPAQTHTERFRPVHNPESGRNPKATARTIIQAKRLDSPVMPRFYWDHEVYQAKPV